MNSGEITFPFSLIIKSLMLLPLMFFLFSCQRETFSVTPDDSLPPLAPVNVNIYAAHDGAIGVEWSANTEQDIKEYNIYRSVQNNNNFIKIHSTKETHYIDFPLSYDTLYTYSISAVDLSGFESPHSAVVKAKPVNRDLPTSIYDISINGRNSGNSKYMHLSWVPQQDYDIRGYEIYRSETYSLSMNGYSVIGFSEFPFFDDVNIVTLKTYYYKVIGVDKGGLKSDYSQVVSDLVLESPVLIFPSNNATVKNLNSFQLSSSSAAYAYKIIIQYNEIYGTVAEFNINSDLVNQPVTFSFDPAILTSYTKYYWRVIAYSAASREPNSSSQLNCFTYIAE